ncbi:STAS domain-containing protein [Pedococcus dokdonensis]|uniref:STAS domain-containing protein n=1 Tax=Pedococcus dokdonensis TaxID=443156 RepID=A0A1H0SIG6_9MICO|nr:STAS domain-containing protein [Pedococcus dokdonensis]SDP40936.1 STAS domain-containing protein [Pedococcus dokdonensis]
MATQETCQPVRTTTLHDASLTHDLVALRSTVAEVLLTRNESVLVDVSDLSRPSSTAVAALLWAKRSCARAGVRFRVRGAWHANRDVLGLCGLLTMSTSEDMS